MYLALRPLLDWSNGASKTLTDLSVGGVATRHDVDRITAGPQRTRQAVGEHGVVFGDQDAHEGAGMLVLEPARATDAV